jgi:glycosyltransferase involved in cell wall biosynthesis
VQIVQLSHYMPPHIGGIEFVAQLVARGLAARGHGVTWFGTAPGHPTKTPNPRDNPRLVHVPAFNWPERRFGLPYPVWSPTFLPAFRRALRSAGCVVAHDCLYPGTLAAAALCGARRFVVVQHVAEVDFGPWLTPLERLAYRTVGRRVLARADHVICCSGPVQAWVQQSLGVRSPCSLVPNGIEDESFALVTAAHRQQLRHKWQLGGRNLLFVGRLVPKKCIPRVLAALDQLPADVSLVVVGDGALEHLVRGRARVRFLGARSRAEVAELACASDAFVLVSEGEGLPLSLQEALLSGLPAVVSDEPAFVANLSGAPGVQFVRPLQPLAPLLEAALSHTEREPIATWARARYGRGAFLDAYERILTDGPAAERS